MFTVPRQRGIFETDHLFEENLSGLCGSHYIYIGERQCLGECICEFWIKGEVNELSDTDASGTRPEEQRQEQEQGAEAAVGPERAVLRSPPAPDSPRTTAPTSEPAWSRFDLRDPGLLRTDLELVNWDTRPCLGSKFSGEPQDFTLNAGKKTGVFNDLEARCPPGSWLMEAVSQKV
ncbi:uncharacterized protein LOC131492546 isoform X2 [Neofelis nebulosa]|uniref:uncharacterized protein LOC131492546 isoform X2 n=1 Tax=Neofelis nebulosa TaxID=61452 RepID=UPI00272D9AC8|nr:uncharacterized protein LOC131492546 isoform X2 [Neofelis nebulosa]